MTDTPTLEPGKTGSETLYRDIVENCADAVVIVTADQTISFVNPAAETMFGYAADEIVGRSLDILIPVSARAGHRVNVEEFENSGERSRFMGERNVTIEGLRSDGTQFPLNVSILRSGTGAGCVLVAIVRDITEQNRLVSTDHLTGALNRRTLLARGDVELKRAQRHKRPIAVAMIDIDHFKKINDTYGHAAGDRTICHVVGLIAETLRDSDIFGRWGGEEFAVILPDIEEESAVLVAQRLRRFIEEASIAVDTANKQKIRITVSIGVAESDETADDLSVLIDRADQALYRAKHAGRNRVCSIDSFVTETGAHSVA